jgi:hypothetical protein
VLWGCLYRPGGALGGGSPAAWPLTAAGLDVELRGRGIKGGNCRLKRGVMGELHGSLIARFEGAGRGEAAGNGRRREGGAQLTRLEVGDGPDSRVPPVSDWS